MKFINGRYEWDVDDPLFPQIKRVFRKRVGPRGERHGFSFAAAVTFFIGAVEATTFATLITVGAALTNIAIAVGLSYGVGLLTKKPQAGQQSLGAQPPQSAQVTSRQSLPARTRSYGTVCRGGSISFEEVNRNTGTPVVIVPGFSPITAAVPGTTDLYVEMLQGQGEIDSVIDHFLGDTEVQIDDAGLITVGEPYANAGVIRIFNMLGTADQEAFTYLTGTFPGIVDDTHRWRGVPKTLIVYYGVPNDQIGTFYGAGPPPYRCIQKSALLYDPREETQIADGDPDRPRASNWEYEDLAGLVMLDYMRHPDGFKRKAPQSGTRKMVPIARFYMPEWIAYINCCDEEVPLKAGGTEKRYRLCGTYDMTSDPKDVLQSMQDACDAEIYTRGDGTIGIHGGKWDAPTVDVANKYLLSHSLKPGTKKLTAYNVLNVKYTAPDNDYQLVDMDPLRDEANITLRGEELNKSVQLIWCPSHGQARRIAKIMRAKDNPEWQGTIVTTPYGLKGIGQRTINFEVADYGINRSFLRTSFKPAPNLSTVEFSIVSLDATAYAWDPETEEGDAPPIPVDTTQDATIPVPADFVALAGSIAVQGGVSGSVIVASWTTVRSTFAYEINWQLASGLADDWNSIRVPPGTTSWQSPVLQDATIYNIRLRSITPAVRASAWTPTDAGLAVTTVADATPPAQPTSFTSSKAGSNVTLGWSNPNSPNFYKTIVYRGGSNVFGIATAIATLYGSPGSARSYADNALANGTYYWWVQSFNASGVASTQVGPQTQTIP